MDLSLQIGKYDIQQLLGKGATGTVYHARDTFSGNEVALKVIEPEVFADPEFGTVYRAQFLNEASLAGKLKHPHIAISDSEKYVALKRVGMLATLADSELWELARAGSWRRVPRAQPIVRENEAGQSFFFLAQGQVKVIRQGRLLNTIDQGECFGEMAYIRGGELPRHATVESLTDIVLAEFEPAALARMSLGAQLALTRALVRNVVDRLELANSRVAR